MLTNDYVFSFVAMPLGILIILTFKSGAKRITVKMQSFHLRSNEKINRNLAIFVGVSLIFIGLLNPISKFW